MFPSQENLNWLHASLSPTEDNKFQSATVSSNEIISLNHSGSEMLIVSSRDIF